MENFVVTKKKFAAVVASIICVIALIIVSCIAINSAKKPKKVSTVANVSEVKEKKSSSVIDEASESVSEASSVPQINSSGSGQSSVISGTSEVSSIADTGSIDESALSRRSALLNVAFLAQKPELPTGCEITSLNKTVTWDINGEKIQWTAPEHCYVLIGYDLDRNVAVISDPLRGIMEYNLQTVKSRYESLYSQCVFITENSISEN